MPPQACGAGFADTDSNSSTACAGCAAGHYSTARACLRCPVGKMDSDSDAGTSCVACPNGAVSAVGATACSGCAAGFSDATGKHERCTRCKAGRFSYKNKVGECSPCVVGRYDHDKDAATPCKTCSAGSFAARPTPTPDPSRPGLLCGARS